VARFVSAFEAGDVDALVVLLTDDICVSMGMAGGGRSPFRQAGKTLRRRHRGRAAWVKIRDLADVFISYSRHSETALVDRLQGALASRGLDCWVDREDIFPSSPWRVEIERAVLEAHAFVFVISPESVVSVYCRAELERAVTFGKRLVPVIAREVSADSVPPELSELQFISFTESTAGDDEGFVRQVGLLVEALSTDIEAVHFHTRLLTQAERWAQESNDRSLLLRGLELTEAEKWLDEQASAGHPVLPQQQRLVRQSRRAAIRRQRGSVTVAVAVAAVMALLAVLTAVEWNTAVNQRRQADTERDDASSLYLAQEAQGQLSVDPQVALLLGLRAYALYPTVQAEDAVRAAVAQSSLHSVLPAVGTESQWPFNATGQWVVSSGVGYDGLALIKVWDLARRSGTGSPSRPVTLRLSDSDVTSAQFSPDGDQVLTLAIRFPSGTEQLLSWAWRTKASGVKVLADVFSKAVLDRRGSLVAGVEANGKVALQDAVGGHVVALLAAPGIGKITGLGFSPDGRLVAAVGAKAIEVWEVNGQPVHTFPVDGSGGPVFSPDDSKLAVAGVDDDVDVVSLSSPSSPPVVRALTLPMSLGGAHCCDVDEAESIAWSPDGAWLVATAEDPVIWLWGGSATSPVYLQYGNEGEETLTGPPSSVAFSPNGQLLLDGNLVWDWQATFDQYLNGPYDDIAVSPRGNLLAAAAQTGGIVLWDWRTFAVGLLVAPPAQFRSAPSPPAYTYLTFSPDGAYLAAGAGHTVSVWRVPISAPVFNAAPAPLAKIVLPYVPDWSVSSVEFAPGGRALVIAGAVVLYWRWGSHQPPADLALKGSFGHLAGFSGKDVRVLATPAIAVNQPSKLLAWDGTTGEVPSVLATIPQRYEWDEAAILPGDKLLLSDQGGTAVFNLRTRRFGPELNGYELGFSLSPSGDLAALTTENGDVEVWDLNGRDSPLVEFTSKGQPFPAMAWGNSGSVLAVADPTDGVKVMPALSYLPFRQLLPIARRLAVTTLDKTQQRQFFP
jgi:WD40 repeat protein